MDKKEMLRKAEDFRVYSAELDSVEFLPGDKEFFENVVEVIKQSMQKEQIKEKLMDVELIKKLQRMLNEAIDLWGTDDIVTKMLSQRLDKEINKEQIKIYEECKKGA